LSNPYLCVGFLELCTITRGIEVTDALLKKAVVKILFAYPVSSGKYLLCFSGEVEDVKSALSRGKEVGGPATLDSFMLPALHPAIIPATQGKVTVDSLQSLGILETVTCASCIQAVDVALKTSKVRLIKIQLARGIGGKAYFVIEGEVGEVNAAMSAAMRQMHKDGSGVIDHVVIPQATPELLTVFE
jgi:microcompartment protein CcmL/EutN